MKERRRSRKKSNPFRKSSEDDGERRLRRLHWQCERSYNDFKVDILEFESQLDLDLFLEWLRTIGKLFRYMDVPKGKKQMHVALKHKKHASIW